MPTYEYKCDCGKILDVFQQFAEPKFKTCKDVNVSITDDCDKNNKIQRLMGKPAIFSDDIGRGSKRMKDKDLYKELDIDK